jgi:hypothetical protein
MLAAQPCGVNAGFGGFGGFGNFGWDNSFQQYAMI